MTFPHGRDRNIALGVWGAFGGPRRHLGRSRRRHPGRRDRLGVGVLRQRPNRRGARSGGSSAGKRESPAAERLPRSRCCRCVPRHRRPAGDRVRRRPCRAARMGRTRGGDMPRGGRSAPLGIHAGRTPCDLAAGVASPIPGAGAWPLPAVRWRSTARPSWACSS